MTSKRKLGRGTAVMSGQTFVSPFHRPQCLAAAAPAGKAKLTHPGKAILAGKKVDVGLSRGRPATCFEVSTVSL